MQGFFPSSRFIGDKVKVSKVAKCGACGLYKTCKSPKMPVDGLGRKRILIVGEAPGKDEDREGKPFVGKTGKYLERALWNHGINMRKDCWITNALICRPPNNDILNEDEKVEHCRPNVINTIEKLQPDVILVVGLIAVKSLIAHVWKEDIGTMERWVGWQIPSQQVNAWICPIWHPSYLMRADTNWDKVLDLWFDKYIENMSNLSGKPWKVVPDYDSQVDIIYDHEKAAKIIRKMIGFGGRAAFDYETNMKKPDSHRAQIVSCSVCWEGKKTIAFPWVGKAIEAMKEFVLSDLWKIASNKKFEDRWTRRMFGHGVKNWGWDTMLAAHVGDCRKHITSIKFQSFVRLGVPCYEDRVEAFLKAKTANSVNRIHEIERKDLLLYNGLDSLLEYKVAMKQMKELEYVPK